MVIVSNGMDTEDKYNVVVILPESMSIPSVNKHKEPGRGGKHMYKNPRVRAYQEEIVEQLKDSCVANIVTYEKPILHVEFRFHFKNRYWRRDVTNMVKATEDALRDVIGIDDGRTVHVTAEKIKHTEKREMVEISVKVFDEDNAR